MDINNPNTELLMQVRTGHRLLAAFYQRLYSNLNKLVNELELSFYVWRPMHFDRPAALSKNPFEKWQWDLLPAMSSYYLFKTDFDNNEIVSPILSILCAFVLYYQLEYFLFFHINILFYFFCNELHIL